jgi:hypothetical protein
MFAANIYNARCVLGEANKCPIKMTAAPSTASSQKRTPAQYLARADHGLFTI